MAIHFSVGQTFESYSNLDEKIGQFEEQNFVKLAKSDCRKIKASAKTTERQINEGLVYSDLKYSCIHGGKAYNSKSKGERQNQSSAKIGCPFTLKLKASKDGQSLEVTKFTPEHNHKTTELEFKFHHKVRKVNSATQREIEQHLQLNANRRLIQQTYKEKTGKNITMKDLHNIGTRMKMNTDRKATSEVQGIGEWIKEQHPGVDCEFVINDKVLTGIFQDAEMKSTFDRFPELLLADSTYKTNNLNLALYAMLSVDGNGESHLVCAFFVLAEDKTSLTDMLSRFKARNPRWIDVKTVITDKDMTERLVFKSCLPSVNLQICLYHTLRSFSREVTMEKIKISSTERTTALHLIEKLAYAQSREDYDNKYAEFMAEVPSSVATYYNSNWHSISDQWVKGLKTYHLQNETTNRVESFFSKLKTHFSPRSTLKDTLTGLFACLETMRSERRYRQFKALNKVKVNLTQQPGKEEFQVKYQYLLTPYAYQMLQPQVKKSKVPTLSLTTHLAVLVIADFLSANSYHAEGILEGKAVGYVRTSYCCKSLDQRAQLNSEYIKGQPSSNSHHGYTYLKRTGV